MSFTLTPAIEWLETYGPTRADAYHWERAQGGPDTHRQIFDLIDDHPPAECPSDDLDECGYSAGDRWEMSYGKGLSLEMALFEVMPLRPVLAALGFDDVEIVSSLAPVERSSIVYERGPWSDGDHRPVPNGG